MSRESRREKLRDVMDRLGLGALLMQRPANFAWYTGGADNRVDHADPSGVAGILLGGNYLDYFVLGATPVDGQHRGIFWVEAGVAITVSGVMLKVFYLFADRRR